MNMKMFATKSAQNPEEIWGSKYRYSGAMQALRSPERTLTMMGVVPDLKYEWLL
jgi:hypothetical protein